jgi:hypothetical protein
MLSHEKNREKAVVARLIRWQDLEPRLWAQ